MATRLQLRTSLRTRLEDTAGSPLWADADLNEALVQSIRSYGQRVPLQKTSTVAIVANTTAYAIPTDAREDAVRALLNVDGDQLPRRQEARSGPGPANSTAEQAWSIWANQILLTSKPATTESWSLQYLASRELVIDDVTEQPIEPGHEPIVIAYALMWAWDRRANEETKRGSKSDATRQREHAASEANRLIAAVRRRARGDWLT